MRKKLKAGIVGCGGIAMNKHLPAIAKIKEVEVTAFCDIKKDRAKKASKEYGGENAAVYDNYKKLLADETLDVVYVLTPNKSHCEITVAALEAGKHVMCEKPMAKTYADAVKMCEAANKSGKKLTIGYQNRYRQDSMYLKEACVRGDLGEVYFAKAHAIRRRAVPTWGVFLNEEEQGGGPLIDIGTHALDLTLWLMDNYKVKSVMGSVYKKLGENGDCGNIFGKWNPAEYTVEDSAFGFITMENGATIFLETSWALNILEIGEAKTTLCGTKAGADMKSTLKINGDDLGRLYVKEPELGAGGVAYYDGATENPADLEAQMWINAVLKNKEVFVKPEEALIVTKVLEAVYESAKTGRLVEF